MEVAAVVDRGGIAQFLPGMHMSQRPVVEARAAQAADAGRSVGLVDFAPAWRKSPACAGAPPEGGRYPYEG